MLDIQVLVLLLVLGCGHLVGVRCYPFEGFPLNEQWPPVARVGEPFQFQISPDTFKSTTQGIQISYEASDLPSWLSFNSADLTFTGATPVDALQDVDGLTTHIPATITGTDPSDGKSMSKTYFLAVSAKKNIDVSGSFNILALLESYGPTNGNGSLILKPNQEFNITFDKDVFTNKDYITQYYGVSEPYNSPLPGWLSFDAGSLKFAGVTPVFQSHIAPQISYEFAIGATDVNDYSSAHIPFSIVVGPHELTTSLQNIITLNVSDSGDFDYSLPLDHVYLDGETISQDHLGDIVLVGAPKWVSLNDDDNTLSGKMPIENGLASSASFSVRVYDTWEDSIYWNFEVKYDPNLFTIGSLPDINVTRGEWFEHSFSSSDFTDLDRTDVSIAFPDSSEGHGWIDFKSSNLTLLGDVPDDFQSLSVSLVANRDSLRQHRDFRLIGMDDRRHHHHHHHSHSLNHTRTSTHSHSSTISSSRSSTHSSTNSSHSHTYTRSGNHSHTRTLSRNHSHTHTLSGNRSHTHTLSGNYSYTHYHTLSGNRSNSSYSHTHYRTRSRTHSITSTPTSSYRMATNATSNATSNSTLNATSNTTYSSAVATSSPVSLVPTKKAHHSHTNVAAIAAGIAVPVSVVSVVLLLLLLWWRRRRNNKKKDAEGAPDISAPDPDNPANRPNQSLSENPFADDASPDSAERMGALAALNLDRHSLSASDVSTFEEKNGHDGNDSHDGNGGSQGDISAASSDMLLPSPPPASHYSQQPNHSNPLDRTSSVYRESEPALQKSWRYSENSRDRSVRESMRSNSTVSTSDLLNTVITEGRQIPKDPRKSTLGMRDSIFLDDNETQRGSSSRARFASGGSKLSILDEASQSSNQNTNRAMTMSTSSSSDDLVPMQENGKLKWISKAKRSASKKRVVQTPNESNVDVGHSEDVQGRVPERI